MIHTANITAILSAYVVIAVAVFLLWVTDPDTESMDKKFTLSVLWPIVLILIVIVNGYSCIKEIVKSNG